MKTVHEFSRWSNQTCERIADLGKILGWPHPAPKKDIP
jgi:hypothetical protein